MSFLVDGAPLSNDAALQYSGELPADDPSPMSLNAGIDMRTLATDEIASVEIIQGIPSVEYGDLTSGLVKIRRKEGGRNLEARFKADLKSQLLYLGKGFEWGERANRLTMNLGVNYLDARADPRNTRQNYRRMTASWRMKKYWTGSSDHRFTLGGSIDYTGSFDRIKSDRDIDIGQTGQPMERYRADYSSLAAALNFTAEATRAAALFRRFEFTASVDADFDITDRWRYVVASANVPIRTALEEGVYDAEILLALRSDPAHRKQTLLRLCQGDGALRKATRKARYTLRLGTDWSMAKNYGGGLLYDITRPFSEQMSTRPRRYDAPAGPAPPCGFAEATAALRPGRWRIDAMAGVRATTMANLGKRYTLQGYVYPDPRVNLSVGLPTFEVAGHAMRITLSGGTGWHTKTPDTRPALPRSRLFRLHAAELLPRGSCQTAHPDGRLPLRSHELRPARSPELQVGGARKGRMERLRPLAGLVPRRDDLGIPHLDAGARLQLPRL